MQRLRFGVYDNQLSVITKSSQGEVLGSQSGCKRSQEWQVLSVFCYADITAGMCVPLVVFLWYFKPECFLWLKNSRSSSVLCRLCLRRLFVFCSAVVPHSVSAGGVYCAKTARGTLCTLVDVTSFLIITN